MGPRPVSIRHRRLRLHDGRARRGRGPTDQCPGLPRAVLVGHCSAGMLALYLAAHYPQGGSLDRRLHAAIAVATPATRDLLHPMLDRLGAEVPLWDAYLAAVRQSA